MYSIGQLAKAADVSNRTLRYYEEFGLLVPRSRGENRYRYYDDSHLQRLNTIKMLQDSGFALKEIVAALSPMLDPQGNITPTGQDMARKIFKALDGQRGRLLERQKELAKTLDEIQKTMKTLVDCFGCNVSHNIEACASCSRGPGEVTYLGRDLIERRNERNAGLERAEKLKNADAAQATDDGLAKASNM